MPARRPGVTGAGAARQAVPGGHQLGEATGGRAPSPAVRWAALHASPQGAPKAMLGEMPDRPPGVRAVLTPARDFWMFSLALAMSRRITLAPFSCGWCRENLSVFFN